MCIPVPILECDAGCGRRVALSAAAFVSLRGHGPGHFCRPCRDILPEEETDP